ncbi:dihydroorotate dehydrogenase (quinone), mitochondrial [Teleopsis dalmanni]|uniref:dihydroorotate dehydrogenase (quinone), mitochondrial n=2 Tax=Teleopsis dalmanni TaxID=139649 RepID=UPI0018CFDD3C|nr:dihydroorotate dehydrogenase (quinone), mitochondrial [Teleopsis dalmanni]
MATAAATKGTTKMSKIKSFVLVTTGAGLFFSGFSIYKGNEKFYTEVIMPVVRHLPAETSHKLAVFACKHNIFRTQNLPDDINLKTTFFDRTISNPIGIAAGFDKHAEAIEGLDKLGFGLIEVGSVTPEPQPGNSTPRVFRLPKDEAIINRYGFNSDGHKAVFERLRELKNNKNFKGVIGVNLGKNKESKSALNDYTQGVRMFGPIADYLVINVSSPNTPGLRDLQEKKDLEQLLEGVLVERSQLPVNNKVPILLKISPDLGKADLKDIAEVVTKKKSQIDGLIVSNTTTDRSDLKETTLAKENGGLSGAPLRSKSTKLIAEMYHLTNGKIPIIGVGGIASGDDAFEKLEAGASYLQFYTAFIYHGPPVVSRIKSELSNILKERGYNNIEEVVGNNYKKYLN